MKKYKILNTKPAISDDEIDSFKNFELLVMKANNKAPQDIRYILKISALVLVTAATIIFVRHYLDLQSDQNSIRNNPEIKSSDLPTVLKEESATSEKDTLEEPIKKDPVPDKPKSSNIHNPSPKAENLQDPLQNEKEEKKEEEYIYIEAEPLGGVNVLYEYFDKELRYPVNAIPDSINGVVLIQFVINTEGKPEQLTILKSPHHLFDEEAKRVITNMPPWKPATINGKPINSKLSIPLVFQIKN